MRIHIASVLIAALVGATPARAATTDEQVKPAVQRAIAFLKQQRQSDGSWPDIPGFPGGVTALCTLALLESGVPAGDPMLQPSLAYLRGLGEPNRTYTTSLLTMVLAQANLAADRPLIARNVAWLETNQFKSDLVKGAWGYGLARGNADNSNTRFALLGLQAAEEVDAKVDPQTWRRALDHWLDTQNPDGSWGYAPGLPGTGSMTCSGIASVAVAAEKFRDDRELARRHDEALGRALDWLAKHYSIEKNPSLEGVELPWLLYYLDTLEDAGRVTQRKKINDHDWYQEGVTLLLSRQDPKTGAWGTRPNQGDGNPIIATSLALLFLTGHAQPQPPPPAAP
jgi:prenyltransferase/squalene oxidase-like repeat protein